MVKRLLTANQVLGQDCSLIVGDICATIHLQLARLAGNVIIRVIGRIPANLFASLLHVVDEEALDDALMDQKDVGIQDVDYGGVVDFTAQPMKRFLGGAAPKGDVEDANATLEQGVGKAQLSESLDRLWLEPICPVSARVDGQRRPRKNKVQTASRLTSPQAFGRLGHR